jgi:hypothetical protein
MLQQHSSAKPLACQSCINTCHVAVAAEVPLTVVAISILRKLSQRFCAILILSLLLLLLLHSQAVQGARGGWQAV